MYIKLDTIDGRLDISDDKLEMIYGRLNIIDGRLHLIDAPYCQMYDTSLQFSVRALIKNYG